MSNRELTVFSVDRLLILRVLLRCFSALLAMTADDKGKGKGKGNQGESGGSTAAVVNVTFGASDVQMIQRYYGRIR